MATTDNPGIPNRSVVTLLRIAWIALTVVGVVQVYTFLSYMRSHYSVPSAEIFDRQFVVDFFTVTSIVAVIVFLGVSAFMIWRRSADRISVLIALFLVAMGTSPVDTYLPVTLAEVMNSSAVALITVPVLGVVAWGGFFIFSLLFPDGRFTPRWSRYILFFDLALVVPINLAPPDSLFFPLSWPPALLLALMVMMIGSTVMFQVVRFARVSDAIQRQQTKWVVYGYAVIGFALALFWVQALVPSLRFGPLGLEFARALSALSLALIPVTITFAILRYRLWDIDLIIRRTVMYSAITALLAAIYFGAVTVLQSGFVSLIGEQSPLAVVVSTLAIAALFTPVRRRAQDFLDRRFNRSHYNAAQTLEAFAEAMRDEVDVDHLSAALVGVVEETMQPESVGLWLRPAGGGGSND